MEFKDSLLKDLMNLMGNRKEDVAKKEESNLRACIKGHENGSRGRQPHLNSSNLTLIKEESHFDI